MKKKALIITAHPDDETLWFSSILLRHPCDIICVTCGSSSREKKRRECELKQAMSFFDVKTLTILDYPDIFKNRIDVRKLETDLLPFKKNQYSAIYTHGPFGDTNEHIHHQDVCYVVNKVFDNVLCTAWNIYPDQINHLSREEFIIKKHILGTICKMEYNKLKTTYEISSVEKFVKLSREAVEVFYWAIANFGDHHQMLGKKYSDIWGYKSSPYELERHSAIKKLVEKIDAKRILEIGAHEGALTDQLANIAKIDCTERASVYKEILKSKGYKVLSQPQTKNYNLVIVASTLEYMDNPGRFLKGMESPYLIIEVIMTDQMNKIVQSLNKKYRVIRKINVLPRWERMYCNGKKQKMEVYKLGATIFLLKNVEKSNPN